MSSSQPLTRCPHCHYDRARPGRDGDKGEFYTVSGWASVYRRPVNPDNYRSLWGCPNCGTVFMEPRR